MKKFLKFFVYGILIICITAVIYLLGVKSSQDDMVFELSYDSDIGFSEYYILKEDNTLIWVYGFGRMGNFTYSTYFSSVDEQGFVKVSDEDAKELKRSMKKTFKDHSMVPLYSINIIDGSEITLKYKNKCYISDFSKREYGDGDNYFSIYDMRKKMKKYVDKYKDMGAYVYYD